jgi:uncharacterized protein
MNEVISNTSPEESMRRNTIVNWKRVSGFLALTFGLTWLLDLVIYLNGGLKNPAVPLALQFQMMIPAFSAIVLGMFVYRDHPLYYRTNQSVSRWFFYYYLAITALYTAAVVFGFVKPDLAATMGQYLLLVSVVGLILLVVLRIVGKQAAFEPVGLSGGKPLYWLIFGLGTVIFYGSQMLLNMALKLGTPVDLYKAIPQLQYQTLPLSIVMINLVINSILIGPFLGLIISFGEEFGWRGFLQSSLIPMGKVKGVLLLGVIWGIWHWPVIWMGYNYPGQPILGSIMMVLFTIGLGFVLAYAVFKAKGIWIAAFVHALNNQTLSFFNGFVYTPNNLILSFGIGLFGMVCLGLVVWLILRDPIWKD